MALNSRWLRGLAMTWDELEGARKRRALRFFRPLAPESVKRAERVKRMTEVMGGAVARGNGPLGGGDFDPELGASGRPTAAYAHSGGPRSARRADTGLNAADHYGEKLTWDGSRLIVEQAHRGGRVYTVAVAGTAPHAKSGVVEEAALFVSAWAGSDPRKAPEDFDSGRMLCASLRFLDARGYAVLVVPEVKGVWRNIADVVQAAGVPFNLYAFPCARPIALEITHRLFPHAKGCATVQH